MNKHFVPIASLMFALCSLCSLPAAHAQAISYTDIYIYDLGWQLPQTGQRGHFARYFVTRSSNGAVNWGGLLQGWQSVQQQRAMPYISYSGFWRRSFNPAPNPRPQPQPAASDCAARYRAYQAAYSAFLKNPTNASLYQDYVQKERAWKACRGG